MYIIHIYYTYILYIYDFHWISMNFLYWRVLSVSSPFIFRIAPSGLQAGSQTGQGQLGHWTRLGLRWTQHANGLALARHVEMPTAGMVFSNVEYHLNVIRTSYEYHMNQIFGYIWIIWDLCPHRCKVISTFTHSLYLLCLFASELLVTAVQFLWQSRWFKMPMDCQCYTKYTE